VRPPHAWAGNELWEPTVSPRLAATPCLVLLGEPGIGKSYALEDMLDATRGSLRPGESLLPINLRFERDIAAVTAHPFLQAWKNGSHGLCLFVDSLDERREDEDSSRLLGVLRDGPLDRLRLRVACRTGELPHSFGDTLRSWWEDSRHVAYLELLPLTRGDVLTAARLADIDADAFLAEIVLRDVVALATRPLTLQFLIEQFRARSDLAEGRRALYESGCLRLCREPSDTRRDHRRTGRLDAAQRLAVARTIAAVSVLAQKSIFYLEPPMNDPPPGALDLRILAESSICLPALTPEDIREVLAHTGLFTARGDGLFGWSHLTYAEFLTAEFLQKRIPDMSQLCRLLAPDALGNQVPFALRGVAAWLSSHQEDVFTSLLVDDVSVLLHTELQEQSDARRAAVVSTLLMRVNAGDMLEPHLPAILYARLSHPSIDDQLRPWIEDSKKSLFARRTAMDIAEGCRSISLIAPLFTIADNIQEDDNVRRAAVAALSAIAGSDARPLIRRLLDCPHDPDDELRGHALTFLMPELEPNELLGYLKYPRNDSFLGKYWKFLNYKFPQMITDSDLPRVIDWYVSYRANDRNHRGIDYIARTEAVLLRRAWRAMPDPNVLNRLAPLVMSNLRRMDSLFGSPSYSDLEPRYQELLKDENRRHLLIGAIVRHDDFPKVSALRLCRQSGLVLGSDLAWLTQEAEGTSDVLLKERWIELIVYCVIDGGHTDDDLDPVLDLAERHPALKHSLRWLLGPVELGSAEAERQRSWHEENEAQLWRFRAYEKKEGSGLLPQERLLHVLGRAESGDLSAVASILTALKSDDAGQLMMWAHDDPSTLPGWKAASPDTRDRIIAVFRRFLATGGEYVAATAQGVTPLEKAYKALRLLVARDRTWLERQPAELWRRWMSTLVYLPGKTRSVDHDILLRLARRSAPVEFMRSLTFAIEDALQVASADIDRYLGGEWDDEIVALLLARTEDPALTEDGLTTLLTLLVRQGVTAARALCEVWLPLAGTRRARAGARALLIGNMERCWPTLDAAFAADPALALAVFNKLSEEDVATLAQNCSEVQLGELYTFATARRPYAPEHADCLLGALRKQLTGRGTQCALDVIRRLRSAIPDDKLLPLACAMARVSLSAKGWAPLTVYDVLALGSDLAPKAPAGPLQVRALSAPTPITGSPRFRRVVSANSHAPMPTLHLDTLQQRYLDGRLVLFVGAGVSQAGGLPSWPVLVQVVLDHARADRPAPETAVILDRAAEVLARGDLILALSELQRAMSAAAYGLAINRALDDGPHAIPPLALAIADLAPTLQSVVTTNLDRFLERAFVGAWPVYTLPRLDLGQREHNILKLHGCRTDRSSWVLTRREYDALHRRHELSDYMRGLYRFETLLFVGYGLHDPDLDALLTEFRAYAAGSPPHHFALMPRGQVDEASYRHLFAEAGLTILEYDPADGHRELLTIIKDLAAAQSAPSAVAAASASPVNATTVISSSHSPVVRHELAPCTSSPVCQITQASPHSQPAAPEPAQPKALLSTRVMYAVANELSDAIRSHSKINALFAGSGAGEVPEGNLNLINKMIEWFKRCNAAHDVDVYKVLGGVLAEIFERPEHSQRAQKLRSVLAAEHLCYDNGGVTLIT